MNKRIKLVLSFFCCIIILTMFTFCLSGCFSDFFYSKEPIIMESPDIDNVSKITINDNEITDETEIMHIINVVFNDGKGRETHEESVNDAFPNAENLVRIEIVYKDKNSFILFAYKKILGFISKEEKYYLEAPYTGVFKITKEEYDGIAKYAKQN